MREIGFAGQDPFTTRSVRLERAVIERGEPFRFSLGTFEYEAVYEKRDNGLWTAIRVVSGVGGEAHEYPFRLDVDACKAVLQAYGKGNIHGQRAGREELQQELRALLGTPATRDVEPRQPLFG